MPIDSPTDFDDDGTFRPDSLSPAAGGAIGYPPGDTITPPLPDGGTIGYPPGDTVGGPTAPADGGSGSATWPAIPTRPSAAGPVFSDPGDQYLHYAGTVLDHAIQYRDANGTLPSGPDLLDIGRRAHAEAYGTDPTAPPKVPSQGGSMFGPLANLSQAMANGLTPLADTAAPAAQAAEAPPAQVPPPAPAQPAAGNGALQAQPDAPAAQNVAQPPVAQPSTTASPPGQAGATAQQAPQGAPADNASQTPPAAAQSPDSAPTDTPPRPKPRPEDAPQEQGGGAYVVDNPGQLQDRAQKRWNSGGSRQCVGLIQGEIPGIGQTKTWKEGAKISQDNLPEMQPGTVIATFVDGRYPQDGEGDPRDRHAAIFNSYKYDDGKLVGMKVTDQWHDQPPHERTIQFGSGHTFVNTASNYSVVAAP